VDQDDKPDPGQIQRLQSAFGQRPRNFGDDEVEDDMPTHTMPPHIMFSPKTPMRNNGFARHSQVSHRVHEQQVMIDPMQQIQSMVQRVPELVSVCRCSS
jgi:hypothetical protein